MEFPLKSFKKDDVILEEGKTPVDVFYLIKAGRVRLSCSDGFSLSEDRLSLEAGGFFAIEAALASHASHCTATALTDVTVLCIDRANFPVFVKENLPEINKMLSYLSGNLRSLNEYLMQRITKSAAEDSLNQIYHNAEYYATRNLFRQAYCAYYKYLKFCPEGSYAVQAATQLKRLASYGNNIRFDYSDKEIRRFYPIDSLIFSEKEPGGELFVIQKGSIKITKIHDDKEVALAIIKKGDILGEIGLIDAKPRSANAIALEDCELMAITRTVYLPLLKDGDAIIGQICVTLSERICKMHNRILSELT
jgi:CRP-like cAMP-binding protein